MTYREFLRESHQQWVKRVQVRRERLERLVAMEAPTVIVDLERKRLVDALRQVWCFKTFGCSWTPLYDLWWWLTVYRPWPSMAAQHDHLQERWERKEQNTNLH